MSMHDKTQKPVKVVVVQNDNEKKKLKTKNSVQIGQSPNIENRSWYDH
jgi:hypothetical protein